MISKVTKEYHIFMQLPEYDVEFRQAHINPEIAELTQTPPFWHGLGWQGSVNVTLLIIVDESTHMPW